MARYKAAFLNENIGVPGRIDQVCNGDFDMVDLPRYYRSLRCQNDGETVHFKIEGLRGIIDKILWVLSICPQRLSAIHAIDRYRQTCSWDAGNIVLGLCAVHKKAKDIVELGVGILIILV